MRVAHNKIPITSKQLRNFDDEKLLSRIEWIINEFGVKDLERVGVLTVPEAKRRGLYDAWMVGFKLRGLI